MNFSRSIPGAAGLAAAWLLWVTTAQAQPPLRIGASLSQSGPYAELGTPMRLGYQLCVKHANGRGGLLGRRLELTVEDDRSDPAVGTRIYEELIGRQRVDAVFSPYSTPITDAVGDVIEKHRMPMIAVSASASIFRKGRKFLFQLLSPAETYADGLTDLAGKRGLKTVAIIHEDTLFPKTIARSAADFAKKRGLEVVLSEAYPKGTADFSPILAKVRASGAEVLVAGTYFEDSVAITRQMRALDVNPKMFVATVGAVTERFYEDLGRDAEFVYGTAQWEPVLATARAGGLIPVARQYVGIREFVDAHRAEYPGAPLNHFSAWGYGGCQVLLEAVRRAGSLNAARVREAILGMDFTSVFGAFRVDGDGVQVGHKMLLFQWQAGQKALVWPEELAPRPPRFPTPPWSQRP